MLSDVRTLLIALLAAAVLSACGGRPVDVEYRPSAGHTGGDWYPIPIDQAQTVTSDDPSLARPPVRVADVSSDAGRDNPLSVESVNDSFGNVSLEVNRNASLTWELLDSAVTRLNWPVADRNRSEYRLELDDPDIAGRGFFGRLKAAFTEERQDIQLILVPKVDVTGISAEYSDDQVLDSEENQRLMSQLRDELLQGQIPQGQ